MEQNSIQTMRFEYAALDEETRLFVQHKADETQRLLKRTAENIILIGQALQEVKERLPHGQFLPWLSTEFGMSHKTANNFMHVAEKFAGNYANFTYLPASILYELAAPSTDAVIIEMIEVGQIAPTLAAIKEVKAALKQAQEAEQQAQKAAQDIQQRLFEMQDEKVQLSSQVHTLEQRLAETTAPAVHIKEVQVPVIPVEVTAQMEQLQNTLTGVSQERDSLVQRVEELGAEARAHVLDRNKEERGIQMRRQWKHMTEEFQHCGIRLLAGWPTSLDLHVFTEDEWAHLLQMQELARLVFEACVQSGKVTSQMIVADG